MDNVALSIFFVIFTIHIWQKKISYIQYVPRLFFKHRQDLNDFAKNRKRCKRI